MNVKEKIEVGFALEIPHLLTHRALSHSSVCVCGGGVSMRVRVVWGTIYIVIHQKLSLRYFFFYYFMLRILVYSHNFMSHKTITIKSFTNSRVYTPSAKLSHLGLNDYT